MDFRDSPEEAAFRKEVREWLQANIPHDLIADNPIEVSPATVSRLREWQAKLHERGWAGIAWPKEYGGGGASLIEVAIFYQEMARANAPGPVNTIGLGMAGPTIIAHGTEEQKRRYLSKILSAEEIWCQGFSEPGAGSDFGSLRSTAVEDGDSFVINGQKVWTSLAHFADWCLYVARTDTAAPKHKGLTYFVVDMHTPGIEVRPLRQITGDASFNEMFFTDVRVPRENILGEVNDGWRVAMTTLLHERGTMGFMLTVGAQRTLNALIDLARRRTINGRAAIEDPVVRNRIGRLHVDVQSMWLNNCRALTATMKSGIPGPEGSLSKLVWSEAMQQMTELAVEILGPAGMLEDGDADVQRWQFGHLRSRGNTIEAGTSEILRNIIAERVLGLPKHK